MGKGEGERDVRAWASPSLLRARGPTQAARAVPGPALVRTRETLPSALRDRSGRATVPVDGGARKSGGSPAPRRSPGEA